MNVGELTMDDALALLLRQSQLARHVGDPSTGPHRSGLVNVSDMRYTVYHSVNPDAWSTPNVQSDDALTSSASDTSVSQLPKTTTTVTKKKKKKKQTKNDTSVRRRHEIYALRSSVVVLETQLSALSEHWRQLAIAAEAAGVTSGDSDSSGPQWKRSVVQQEAEREASERANRALRARVQAQCTTLRRIRKLLAERAAAAAHVQRELLTTLRVRLALDSNTSALQFLLSDSTAMVGASRNVQVMVSRQGGGGASDAFRAWSAKYEPDLGLFVEMVDRFVVPFDRRVVELAHQRHHSELCSKETTRSEFTSSSNDVIMSQYVDGKNIRERRAVRTVRTGASTLFAVSTLVEVLTEAGELAPMVPRFHRKTWIRVSVCRLSTPKCPVTVIETYSTLIPKMDESDEYTKVWTSANLNHFLIPYLDPQITDAQRNIEDELILLNANSRTQGSAEPRPPVLDGASSADVEME